MKLKYGREMSKAEIREMLISTANKPECWVVPRWTKKRAAEQLAYARRIKG
jgi:hypothetical protein